MTPTNNTSVNFAHFACAICVLLFSMLMYGLWRHGFEGVSFTFFILVFGLAFGAVYFYKRSNRRANDNSFDLNSATIADYNVVYKGGLPSYPSEKLSSIKFSILSSSFKLEPTSGSENWFTTLEIPFSDVSDLQIVQRQVSTAEAVLGGLDSRQLNQANNIHLSFLLNGTALILRLEMLTGFTVMGQAAKCQELEDRIRTNGIRQNFSTQSGPTPSIDIEEKIRILRELLSKGLIDQAEYDKKKQEILSRL